MSYNKNGIELCKAPNLTLMKGLEMSVIVYECGISPNI